MASHKHPPLHENKVMLQLVKGSFTATESAEIVMALLNEKINFHHRQQHQNWEKDHKASKEDSTIRILELEQQKELAMAFIARAAADNTNITIHSALQLVAEEKTKQI